MDQDPYLAGTVAQLLFEAAGIRDAMRWMFHTSALKSSWSSPTVLWRSRLAEQPQCLRSMVVDLLVDLALRRVTGIGEPQQTALSSLRSLLKIDQSCALDVAATISQRHQFDVLLPWLRDLPPAIRIGDNFATQLMNALSSAGGQPLGYAISILRDVEARGVMSLDAHWATFSENLAKEVTRGTTVESVAWALAGLVDVPPEHRPMLAAFIPEASQLISHIADFRSAVMPLCVYLSALSSPVITQGDANLIWTDRLGQLIMQALLSEPSPTILNLVRDILDDQTTRIDPEVRSILIASLSGASERHLSTSALDAVRSGVRQLPERPRDLAFQEATAALRAAFRDLEQTIDFHLAELLAPIGIELDDLLRPYASEIAADDNPVNQAVRQWTSTSVDKFVALFRTWLLVSIRASVSYADALIHDASHASDEIEEIVPLVEQDLARRMASRPQRHDQPWNTVYQVVVSVLNRRGWRDIPVAFDVPPSPLGGAERATRFDPDDLDVVVDNLLSNAISRGSVRVSVDREQLAVLNAAEETFTADTARDLEEYLRGGGTVPPLLRIGRGLKSVRRCLASNGLLRLNYRLVEPDDDGQSDREDGEGRFVVATLSWLPPRMREVRNQ